MKRKFVIDEEISFVNEHDILKTQVYADSLVKIIKNTPQDKVFTIGLFGNWGSGKSSIIKTAKDIIEQKDDKVKFITYDAWKYVNDSFRRMFLLKIQQELKQGQTESMQRFYQSESVEAEPKTYVSTNGLAMLCLGLLIALIIIWCIPSIEFETKVPIFSVITLVGLLITIFGGIFQKLKVQINKPIVFAPEQFEDCFKEMISKSLKKRGVVNDVYTKLVDYTKTGECSVTNINKLVIVIDNIDRCHNEMAYQLLTDIKTFLSDERLNVVFVIPVDDEALKRNLFSNNDCNKEKEEFLRKFFNVTLRIKPHQNTELNAYARELNHRYNLGFNANTLALCSKEFATNPRRIIQLFNNLSSELSQYPVNFAQRNESAICAILILREEYPEYYERVVRNPYKFKQGQIRDDEKNVASFMRFVSPIARYIELKDLLKILTNSDAIFDVIPEEVRNSIFSYDVDGTSKYINQRTDLKDEIFACLLKNVKDNIKSHSDDQIINSIEFISGLSVLVEFEQVFLQEIDDIFNSHYIRLLGKIDKAKLENLCQFASILNNYGFETLKRFIIQHVTNIGENHENIDEPFIKAMLTVFNTDEDSKKLSEFTTKLFDVVDIYTDIQYSAIQFEFLFTEELVNSHINRITIGENKETEELLWLIEHKKNIEEESYLLLFDKISNLIGPTANKAKTEILTYILYITRFVQHIENLRINNPNKLSTLNMKLEYRLMHSTKTYILDDYKNSENIQKIINYSLHIYRVSNGVISNIQVQKMWQYDKEYLYFQLVNLQQDGYNLEPFHNVIMSDSDYSIDNLMLLTKHCLLLKNASNDFFIGKDIVKTKIDSLLSSIKIPNVQDLIEQLVLDYSLKELIIESITNRDSTYINELPISLLDLAIGDFTKETSQLYENNMGFLSIIALKGTIPQKNELVNILTGNITDRKNIKETFDILETINLENDFNLKMLYGALQSYKINNNTDDERINALIERFRTTE